MSMMCNIYSLYSLFFSDYVSFQIIAYKLYLSLEFSLITECTNPESSHSRLPVTTPSSDLIDLSHFMQDTLVTVPTLNG